MQGTTDEVRESFEETFGAKMAGIMADLKEPLMDIGESMLPIIENVAEIIKSFSEWFSSLDEGTVKHIGSFALIVTAIAPVLSAMGEALLFAKMLSGGFGNLASQGATASNSLGILQKSIKFVAGPAGLVALVSGIIAVMAVMGDNEEKLTELQEKWGVFGEFIGTVCEGMTGTVQLSLGNIAILISTLGKIIMAVLSGDFKSIDDIWSEGWAKVENNTAKAMSNIQTESSRGIALMRDMAEVELNNLTGTFEIALQKLPSLTADNASEMANTFVTRMQGLDEDTLTILRGTSDTMAVLFEGIYANMDNDEAHKKFTANLESMAKSGEFTSDKISTDISDAMNLIDRNVADGSERVKRSAQSMFDGIANISQFGMDSAVQNIVSSINSMSDETINSLSAMGGHWETLFGGIALTGKDSVSDMEGHIKGRLEDLSKTSPQFVLEMKDQMSIYFEQINQSGSINIDQLDTNTEQSLSNINNSLNIYTATGADGAINNAKRAKDESTKQYKELSVNTNNETKNISDNINKNLSNGAINAITQSDKTKKGVSKNYSEMANEAKKGTNQLANNTDVDMQKANKAVQQSATDMYNGSKKSYSKMADVAREEGSRMYNGVTTSAQKMSDKARQSASDMYNGVTTSTSRMADKAIADWNRIRTAYSKSISGTVTKTTVNKVISEQSGSAISIINDDSTSFNNIRSRSNFKTPDISEFGIRGRYYNASSLESSAIAKNKHNNFNNIDNTETNELLKQLIYLIKDNSNTGDLIIPISIGDEEIVRYISERMARNTRKRM